MVEREINWEWTDSVVEMIPFGLLTGFYGKKEIRITKLAEEGFCFRSAEKFCGLEKSFRFCFYDLRQSRYREIPVIPVAWRTEQKTEFFTSYAVAVQQEDYRKAVRALFCQYDRYIRLKLEEDDSDLAEQMTGYPAKEDDLFADSFQEQMVEWFGTECMEREEIKQERVKQAGKGLEILQSDANRTEPELALELDHPRAYTLFLQKSTEEFLEDYQERYPVFRNWLQGRNVNRFYIGNAFCHLLFPKEDQLFQLLEKARKESLQVTLTFSYIREFMLENTGQLIEKLENWCEENKVILEIQVNDWAMAEMLKGKSLLVPALGILLNKRRKDPRLHYKTGTMEQIGADADKYLSENNLNADFYREYLKKEYGIVRYEWESCGYDMTLPPGKNSLHLPFYQTNTSQYCTLYAKCMTGERGKQKLAEECPKFCKDYAFLYPDHLIMIGRYNSLFALDSRIFEDGSGSGTGTEIGTKIKTEKILKEWKKAGVDRLVVNLLDSGVKR